MTAATSWPQAHGGAAAVVLARAGGGFDALYDCACSGSVEIE